MDHRGAIVVGLGDRDELTWAAREAELFRQPLHIVRACDGARALFPWETSARWQRLRDLRASAQERIDWAVQYARAESPTVEVEGFVVEGRPVDALLEAAASADLVVVGRRSLGDPGSTLLGSVSAQVAATACSPVAVVGRPPADLQQRRTVVAGIDRSRVTDEVLEFAFAYADRHGSALRIAYCWPKGLSLGRATSVPSPASRWLADVTHGWQQKYPEVPVHRDVVRDEPVDGLVGASTTAELLVVGAAFAHARTATLLGSVSQGVLRHAGCPVALVHAPRS